MSHHPLLLTTSSVLPTVPCKVKKKTVKEETQKQKCKLFERFRLKEDLISFTSQSDCVNFHGSPTGKTDRSERTVCPEGHPLITCSTVNTETIGVTVYRRTLPLVVTCTTDI